MAVLISERADAGTIRVTSPSLGAWLARGFVPGPSVDLLCSECGQSLEPWLQAFRHLAIETYLCGHCRTASWRHR